MKDLDSKLQRNADAWHADMNVSVAESERVALAHLRHQTLINRIVLGTGVAGAIIVGVTLMYQLPGTMNKPGLNISHGPNTSSTVQTEKVVIQVPHVSVQQDVGSSQQASELNRAASSNKTYNENYPEIDSKAGGFDAEYGRISKVIAALPADNHLGLLREHRGVAQLCVRWSKYDLAEQHLRHALAAANAIGDHTIVQSVSDQLTSLQH